MLFIGDDWAEAHHDVEIQDEDGRRLVRRRLPEGVAGMAVLHDLVAGLLGDGEPADVIFGIETDRGPWVQALIAAGYQVYAINPLSVARYRERHVTSGAKSDAGDAKVLADLVRTDRHQHRPIAGDSDLAEAVKVLARAHQNLIWSRQRQANSLRSTLREFYPAALTAFEKLTDRDALAVLEIAPTPTRGRSLSRAKIAATLRRAGRQRYIDARAEQIETALRTEQLAALPAVEAAFGHTVTAMVRILTELSRQIGTLEGELSAHFDRHPDAEILLSQPGLGPVLAARVLAEFGDDPHRYDVKARRNYAATSPITRASGTRRLVLARHVANNRLRDALYLQAFAALKASPGARAYHDAHRARGNTHHQALRALANRLVGILHGCLRHQQPYNEAIAWPAPTTELSAAA
ncbi:IS110 family transposase [Micromonospora halotolerans]|uniref:IS110 family transposase n=1 Tax=Micromonospora halotolerans TaxID=709879 RepID=A0ABZ0A2V5_9ACTN|nr:IS110 family transposase [Micromonospora halotolerans]WNM41693.1 IS110 family transposase [Micromonospora halotolerans]